MSILDLQLEQQPIEVKTLATRVKQINDELLTQTPQLPDALVHIHKMIQEHEELVHLLEDDDIMKLHQAHEKHKQFHLVNKEVKKVGKNKKVELSSESGGGL